MVSKFDHSDINLALESKVEDVINTMNNDGGFTIVY